MQRRPDLRAFVGMKPDDDLDRYLDLIQTRVHVQWDQQFHFVHDENGTLLVDKVCRMERIQEQINAVFARLGLGPITVPHSNQTSRRPYREYFNAAQAQRVAEIYRKDIEWLGYEY